MNRLSGIVVLCVTASSPLYTLADQTCVELARVITYNQTQSYSKDDIRDINKAAFCEEHYKKDDSARSANIEASYKVISGKAGASESEIREEQSKTCENKYGEYWRSVISNKSAQVVSKDALAVIDNCQILTSNNMTPKITVSNSGEEFSLTLKWNPPVSSQLKLYQAGPIDLTNYKCSATLTTDKGQAFKPITAASDINTVLGTGESFMLGCTRKAEINTIDGEALSCYKEALLNINTNGPTTTLKLPANCSPSMPGARAVAMEKRILELEAGLKSTQATTSDFKDHTNKSMDDLTTRAGQVQTELTQRAKLRWKTGDNGSKSCSQFCMGEWGGFTGASCVHGWDTKTNQRLECSNVTQGVAELWSCLCSIP